MIACSPVFADTHSFNHPNLPPDVKHALRMERLEPSRRLHLTVTLPTRNANTLEALAKAMYEKGNPQYHKYLTPYQFASEFGPTDEDYQKMIDFLKAQGLEVEMTFQGKLAVNVSGRVDKIEKVFHVHLHNYQRGDGSRFYAPDVEPSVDTAVEVEHVDGLDNARLPRVLFHKGTPKPLLLNGSGTSGNYWGNDIRSAYIPGVTQTGAGQSVGVVSFESYLSSDVATYCTDTGIAQATAQNVTCGSYSNLEGSGDPDHVEMTLDMEMVNTMAPGCTINAYIGDSADAVFSQIVSDDTCNQVTASYAISLDTTTQTLITQLAVQGQSYMNAAGDGGSYVNGSTQSSSGDPQGLTGCVMEWPWVTVVGGTELSTTGGSSGSYVSEQVWNNYPGQGDGGGGGFSTDIAIPSYQSNVSMATNNGSTSFRNLPDVACLASDVQLIVGGSVMDWIDGTSAASPLWAGYIALVNQKTASQSKPPLGFLNPSIYAIGGGSNYTSDFNDVKTGNNDITGSNPTEYAAVTGYDLATGWGSMKGAALMTDLIANYVAPTATITPTPSNTPGGCAGNPGATWNTGNFEALGGEGGGVFDAHDGNGPVPAIIGGKSGSVTTAYQWVAGTWTAYSMTTGPVTNRTNYDVAMMGQYMWVIGGLSGGSTYMNDVWRTWDGIDYSLVNSSAAFPGRDNFATVVFNNKLWVIGGQTSSGAVTNDVWSSPDGITWTAATANAAFSARQLHSAVAFNGKLWVFGGKNVSSTLLNDVWNSSDGATWSPVAQNAAFTARQAALATVCGDDIWMIGGATSTGATKDVWVSEDGATWADEAAPVSFGAAVSQYAASAFAYNGNVWVVSSNGAYTSSCCSLPTFTPTKTSTSTPSSTQTVTNTPTKTETETATASPTNSSTQTVTQTPTSTSTPTASSTPTNSATSSATKTPTSSATQTSTPTVTFTPTSTPSSTVTNSATNTSTPTVTNTSSSTPTVTNSATGTSTSTVTESATSTGTPTVTETATESATSTSTNTVTQTPTVTNSETVTNTETVTSTETVTETATESATSTSTNTVTNTATVTNSETVTFTQTVTNSPTATPSATVTNTPTNTGTVTDTQTNTPTNSLTPTFTNTSSSTATAVSTNTSTASPTVTITGTYTGTPTITATVGTVPVIYPNPVLGPGPVFLLPPLHATGNVKVEIFTLGFRCVRTINFSQVTVGTDLSISLMDNWNNTLANGLYYVRVTTPQGHAVVKLLILR